MTERKKIGVLVNPMAGLGGRVGLKGSDGEAAGKALAMGAEPRSGIRTALALSQLAPLSSSLEFLCPAGEMGEIPVREAGFEPHVIGSPLSPRSSADDTRRMAKLFEEAGVDLVLFAGGDGTARDMCAALGSRLPVIGIPAGVKMHSAVYAVTPRAAGFAAREFLEGRLRGLKEAEVMDIDEDLFRRGSVNARLYGYMTVPDAGSRMQAKKSGGQSDAAALAGIAARLADDMRDDVLSIIGPGSTMKAVTDELSLPGTLLGVDVVLGDKLLAADATEQDLLRLLADDARKAQILVTVIGGQGSLFGRGNQQISPAVIRRVLELSGPLSIRVAATPAKLLALGGKPFSVDTGDPALDEQLAGHVRVVTGYDQTTIYRVG